MIKVNVLEAKNRLSELLRAVARGEEVVIANRGQPVARLVAAGHVGEKHPPVGSAAAVLKALSESRLPDSSRRSAEEIEAYLAEERASWD